MGKYAEDAKELLGLVGGKGNIAAVSHCMTRMRFVLNEPAKADVKKIEAMKAVKGSFTQSGQFQVIIGNTVADFYNDFVAVAGIEGVSKDAVKQAAKQNQNVLQRIVTALAEIFAPLIPAIITGGLILGFRNCIDSLYLFENGTKTLCDISQFWAGIDSFLWLIGEAVFHMLPVGICWSVTKKMGTTQRGYSRMEFRRLPGEHDRLSGAGNPGDTGSVYVGIFGKIFPEDNASGGFDDSRSVLQSASGGNSSAFYSRAGGLENRFCDFFRSVCRDYGFV